MRTRIGLASARAARLAGAVLCAVVAGCAAPQLTSIAPDGPLAVVSAGRFYRDRVTVAPARQVIATDASAGAGVGLAAGVALGLACGPFAPVCIGPAMQLGLYAGAGVGHVAAYAETWHGDIRDALRAAVSRYDEAHPPGDAAIGALRERVAAQWTLAADDGKAPRIVVKRVRAYVELLPDDQAQPYVTVTVRTEIPGPDAWKAPDRIFDYTGTPAALATWAEDRDDYIAGRFDAAYAQIARDVVAEMTR